MHNGDARDDASQRQQDDPPPEEAQEANERRIIDEALEGSPVPPPRADA